MSQNYLPETEGESVGNGLDVVRVVAKNLFIKYEVLFHFVICNSKIQNKMMLFGLKLRVHFLELTVVITISRGCKRPIEENVLGIGTPFPVTSHILLKITTSLFILYFT